ncbi:MAG: hypothetical protein QOI63_190 [Thermoplasmata archaeon]|jgi:hypothetical protein|nr:hypothetical protein [Thermoplasmata archaeon]
MVALTLMVPTVAADGPVATWPRCAAFYVTTEPVGYHLDQDCLAPPVRIGR